MLHQTQIKIPQKKIQAKEEQQTQIRYECFTCKQQLLKEQIINDNFMNNFSKFEYQNKLDTKQQFYHNILCSQCEQKFNKQDSQIDIFKKLVCFFDDTIEQKQSLQDTSSSTLNTTSDKRLKIKDLVRLLMHMLNEITGIAKVQYEQFEYLMDIKQNKANCKIKQINSNSRLQNYISNHQIIQQKNKSQSHDQQSQKEDDEVAILKYDEGNDSDEGKGKQSVNSFSMESPFSKQPKRIIKKTNLAFKQNNDKNSNDLKQNKQTENNQSQIKYEKSKQIHIKSNLTDHRGYTIDSNNKTVDCRNQLNNSFLVEDCPINISNSVDFKDIHQNRQSNKSGFSRSNTPQIPSNRSQLFNKFQSNQKIQNSQNNADFSSKSRFGEQDQEGQIGQKSSINNSFNISINNNNDLTQNSIFTNINPSMMLMTVTNSNYNQSFINSSSILDFRSTKHSAQQAIFSDGPANRKLQNIKQLLLNSNSDLQYIQQQKILPQYVGDNLNQTQAIKFSNINKQKRAISVQNEGRIAEIINFDALNNTSLHINNCQNVNDKQVIDQNVNIPNNVKMPKGQPNLKNLFSNLSSTQNFTDSLNQVNLSINLSQKNRNNVQKCQISPNIKNQIVSKLQQPNDIETIQSNLESGMTENLDKISNKSQAEDFFIFPAESPKTPTDESVLEKQTNNINNTFQVVQQNMTNKENEQNQQNNQKFFLPKTLKYKSKNTHNIKNSIHNNQDINIDSEIDKNIDLSFDKFNNSQFITKDRYQSHNLTCGDSSLFRNKSLNNSVNVSVLNKSLPQDSNLSLSMMNQSKQFSTTPIQEKIIIKSLMTSEYGDVQHNGYHQENVGIQNQAKYIISASWWRDWIDYVGFNDTIQISQENANQIKKDRPKKIKNKSLLKGEQLYNFKNTKNIELRDNLLEHYDYEAIPKSIFNYLKLWYGVDYEIIRFLKYDPSQPLHKSVHLDLYPEKTLASSLPMGIRKRQKNSTVVPATSANLKEGKDNVTTYLSTYKTVPSKRSKNDKVHTSLTSGDTDSFFKNIKEEEIEEEKQNQKNKKSMMSLDLDKINVTLIKSQKQNYVEYNKAENSHRSIAKEKSKACTIF